MVKNTYTFTEANAEALNGLDGSLAGVEIRS